MQTFLPYRSFKKTAKVLDYRRLGKQRVEAFQILNTIEIKKTNPKVGWSNHPAVLMWEGFELALSEYFNIMVLEWIDRGYNNNMGLVHIIDPIVYPPWLGSKKFHISHRSNLLRKDFNYYSQFNWNVSDDLEYVWPVRKETNEN